MGCLFHKWDGCKCAKCGKTRDEGHSFENVQGKCLQRCLKCGVQLTLVHTFVPLDGVCEEQCQICHDTRKLPHAVQGGACVKCGKSKDAITAEYENDIASVPANRSNAEIRDGIKDIATRYAGIGEPIKLYPLCEAYANTMMAALEDFWKVNALMKKGNIFVSTAGGALTNIVSFYMDLRSRSYASQLAGNNNLQDMVKVMYQELFIPYAPEPSSSGQLNMKSQSYYTFKDRIGELIKPDTYRDSPIAFFFKQENYDLLNAIGEEKREEVLNMLYNHAVSWVNQMMNK